MFFAPFDCGRGCPFQCSFCTIINVQGRRSRYRDADDVERILRASLAQGIRRFFITDDNLARTRTGSDFRSAHRDTRAGRGPLQVRDAGRYDEPPDPGVHRKSGAGRVQSRVHRAGKHQSENLVAANKFQNRVGQYRAMLQAWRARGVVTYAGYILGLPGDTPESIERDIKLIQKELPIDILEFMMLTPLPGSADHKALYQSKA